MAFNNRENVQTVLRSFSLPENPGCRFCSPYADDIVTRNVLRSAPEDRFFVSKGHLLIIPFRHMEDHSSLYGEEKQVVLLGIDDCRAVSVKISTLMAVTPVSVPVTSPAGA